MINTTNTRGFECCRMCMNNPANNPHATGFCNCTLPYMELYGRTTAAPSTSTEGYEVKRSVFSTRIST